MGRKSWFINAEGPGDVVMGRKLIYLGSEGLGDAVIGQKSWYCPDERDASLFHHT